MRISVSLVMIILAIAGSGCSTSGSGIAQNSQIQAQDIDALAGPAWVGTLTYLDYSSHKRVVIDSSLRVRRTSDAPPAWEFVVGYSKEPHADSAATIEMSADGHALGDEQIIGREPIPGGGVRFQTETDGEDDQQPARFRFEYTITAHEYVKRKLVRVRGRSEFFERHIYRLAR